MAANAHELLLRGFKKSGGHIIVRHPNSTLNKKPPHINTYYGAPDGSWFYTNSAKLAASPISKEPPWSFAYSIFHTKLPSRTLSTRIVSRLFLGKQPSITVAQVQANSRGTKIYIYLHNCL